VSFVRLAVIVLSVTVMATVVVDTASTRQTAPNLVAEDADEVVRLIRMWSVVELSESELRSRTVSAVLDALNGRIAKEAVKQVWSGASGSTDRVVCIERKADLLSEAGMLGSVGIELEDRLQDISRAQPPIATTGRCFRLVVSKVMPGSSGAACGLRVGDGLVGISGMDVRDCDIEHAMRALWGDVGTTVVIDVSRKGSATRVTAVRGFTQVRAPNWRLEGRDVAVVTPRGLEQESLEDFQGALDGACRRGARRVVLDLRGRNWPVAAGLGQIAGAFLKPDVPLVVLRDRNGRTSVTCSSSPRRFIGPMAVVVDGKTACGAEVLAAALKSVGRIPVLGVSTAGESLLASEFLLPSGDRLILRTHVLQRPPWAVGEWLPVTPSGQRLTRERELQRPLSVVHRPVDEQLAVAVDVVQKLPLTETAVWLNSETSREFR
jgi:hypothetical protein